MAANPHHIDPTAYLCGFGVVGTVSPHGWYQGYGYLVLQGFFFHS